MKCKNGLDLCGFQLTNFCVQGEASAPSDAALGRKYFHTNATDDVATGISLLHRERIYLGEGAWRATAYLDDIAAINEKLNLITGDTDTDTLINNLKDLEEFLKDFSETDKLKSLLDGKLDKSGGTIEGYMGALKIKRNLANMSAISYENTSGLMGYLGFYRADIPAFRMSDNTTTHVLIHDGNIGSYNAGGLAHSNGTIGATVESNGRIQVGAYGIIEKESRWRLTLAGLSGVNDTALADGVLLGSDNGVILKGSGTNYLILNSSGNVTIGGSDSAGTSAKLCVEGKMRVTSRLLTGDGDDAGIWRGSHFSSGLAVNDIAIYGENKIVLYGGNVLIGTSSEIKSGVKLQVKGDLYVDGNIIATKEVSAGGAGAEEGGSGSGSAEGVSEIFTPTSTSMAFDHNLGEDVIVQVYEKSGNVWNMVMVDTEITSATRVTLRFGKTETTQHKVVIMGV